MQPNMKTHGRDARCAVRRRSCFDRAVCFLVAWFYIHFPPSPYLGYVIDKWGVQFPTPRRSVILDEETRELVMDILPTSSTGGQGVGGFTLLEQMVQSHTVGKDLCIVGSRGAGKTFNARAFAAAAGYVQVETLHLYQDMTARDLLQGWWAKNGGAEVRCLPAGCWKLDSPRHAMYRRAPC